MRTQNIDSMLHIQASLAVIEAKLDVLLKAKGLTADEIAKLHRDVFSQTHAQLLADAESPNPPPS